MELIILSKFPSRVECAWMQSETETGVYFITKSSQLKCVARKCKLFCQSNVSRSPRRFGPSITRNLITHVLTIRHVKLTQSTALEQKRFDRRSLSPALLYPLQRLPLGIPIKIAIIEKIESARGTMGRGKRRSLFLSSQPPHNTKRPLRRRKPALCNL